MLNYTDQLEHSDSTGGDQKMENSGQPDNQTINQKPDKIYIVQISRRGDGGCCHA